MIQRLSGDTLVSSAPGKVLLTGGYLVLDPKYSGLSLATPCRFYSLVSSILPAHGQTLSIEVRSPQFIDALWKYTLVCHDQEWSLKPLENTTTNAFLEIALLASVKLASALYGTPALLGQGGAAFELLADNDFYSQSTLNDPSHLSTHAQIDESRPGKIRKLSTTIQDVHKTGLGSSAALVTSFISAILHHFNSSAHKPLDRVLLHNLTQYAHSYAQGKIGSGFDISTANFGSQLYRRFDPCCLADLIEVELEQVTPDHLLRVLDPSQNKDWSAEVKGSRIESVQMPNGLALLLADVDAGSSTPGMVKKVLAWRRHDPEQAQIVWDELAAINDAVAQRLQNSTMTQRSEAWVELQQFRQRMKAMGQAAGADIEPDQQTRLLDALTNLRGVLGGVVPGAGGLDALVLLVQDDSTIIAQVEEFMRSWKEIKVTPLSKAARIHRAEVGRSSATGLQVTRLADMADLQRTLGDLLL